MSDSKSSSHNTKPEYLAEFQLNPLAEHTAFDSDADSTIDSGTNMWVLEDPGTEDDEPTYENLELGATETSDHDDEGHTTTTGNKKWTTVETRKKKFWDPVFDRPTSRRFDGKGGPVMMCPNRNKPGGCKTMLPCACGRVGHLARHNEHKALHRNQFMMSQFVQVAVGDWIHRNHIIRIERYRHTESENWYFALTVTGFANPIIVDEYQTDATDVTERNCPYIQSSDNQLIRNQYFRVVEEMLD